MLGIDVRYAVGSQLAGQFTHGMRAHAVRYHEQMAAGLPLLRVVRGQGGERILVVTAPEPNVAQSCVLNLIKSAHPSFPERLSSTFSYATGQNRAMQPAGKTQ